MLHVREPIRDKYVAWRKEPAKTIRNDTAQLACASTESIRLTFLPVAAALGMLWSIDFVGVGFVAAVK